MIIKLFNIQYSSNYKFIYSNIIFLLAISYYYLCFYDNCYHIILLCTTTTTSIQKTSLLKIGLSYKNLKLVTTTNLMLKDN